MTKQAYTNTNSKCEETMARTADKNLVNIQSLALICPMACSLSEHHYKLSPGEALQPARATCIWHQSWP